MSNSVNLVKKRSKAPRKRAETIVAAITIKVNLVACCFEGQATLLNSVLISCKKTKGFAFGLNGSSIGKNFSIKGDFLQRKSPEDLLKIFRAWLNSA
jgi:uncharacterized lipoprotein YehR (DUF1307 family)